MKKKRAILIIALLIAVLFLGIGYAVISSVNLSITGTATASPSDDNFSVKFVSSKNASNATDTTSSYPATATTFSTSGLTSKGDKAEITYTISNSSEDLSAEVAVPTVNVTGTNAAFFSATTDWGSSAKTIAKGATQDVKVTITLEQTPIDSEKTATVTVTTTASPVQP